MAAPIRNTRNLVRSARSEEHTSELQSRGHLVCRLLLEKKKELTLSQSTKVKINGKNTEATKVLQLTITGGPFPVRALPFFFNVTATTEIYTLSLHDALPI